MEEKDKKQTTVYIEEDSFLPHIEPDLIDPGEGKAWRRKSDGLLFYGNVYLGKRFYSSTGKPLKSPVQELPDDFELVEIIKTE